MLTSFSGSCFLVVSQQNLGQSWDWKQPPHWWGGDKQAGLAAEKKKESFEYPTFTHNLS